MLISAEHIAKRYGDRTLLSDVSLYVKEGDKIGIVGINGTGKSTLLSIAAGAGEPDAGERTIASGLQIGYLPQNPVFPPGKTVLEAVLETTGQGAKEFEARRMLTKLGLADLEQEVSTLSGGQKKRAAIAAVLARPQDVLILDEPTNHLDSDMTAWLEEYLQKFTGGMLMVTHDRYFLDRVTNRIGELDRGGLYLYDGNYETYLERKAQRDDMERASQRKRESFLKKELEWIQRGARARGTKSQFRIQRFEELREQTGPAEAAQMDMASLASRLGKKTAELHHVAKSFDGRTLIEDFSYILLRRDRVGIIGPNGCGKTTLLKIMAGMLSPDAGSAAWGDTVKIGYFSQDCETMDPSQRVIEYIRQEAEQVRTEDGVQTASQMLERFLFPGETQYTPVGRLSGGERRRLYLLRVLMSAPNILLLDEPTNDLDITTLTILEDYLEAFPGAVVTVSHDRYFLDKVVERIFAFNGDGTLRMYMGGYSDYAAAKSEESQNKVAQGKSDLKQAYRKERPAKLKFTFAEQREFETIDDEIASLEEAVAGIEREMEAQASQYLKLQELQEEKDALQQRLVAKMERWVYLTELEEKIQAQQNHSEGTR